ncbi:hypothetical protein EGI26_14310 [Lacihabitans sp. CCS-44]|uniref:hypothetical protein n=1 Tax=Lacihabitans sp. CCS-44 TaxID=2487331 RepID=UPI0020CBE4B9|nr:hypothetical protein [Lacihabitans sp. CCS-44]MCP9756334.1 hypothetical protein [Lacihabitans sp. CCS-44]
MQINFFEWIGYAASLIVAISLVMSSIVKFRWTNLMGSALFAAYGFLIQAWPVCFFNSAIVFINLYFLYKIYSKKDEFKIIKTSEKESLLNEFVNFYKKEIEKISPDFDFNLSNKEYNYFITRNMALVGLFLAHKESDGVLSIDLDFVTPQYRDFKNGSFLYEFLTDTFQKSGIKTLTATGMTPAHQQYLKEMGFKNNGTDVFVKQI